MNKKERQELSNFVMVEVLELGLQPYYTIFIANLVLEKLDNPTKGTRELVDTVSKIMPKKYFKSPMQVSTQKTIEMLEEALHDCEGIYKLETSGGNEETPELYKGLIVKNTINYFVDKVMNEY